MKVSVNISVFFGTIIFSAFASATSNDYSISFYGDTAQKIFQVSKKMNGSCSYVEANDGDSLGKDVEKLINDANINSVQCIFIGEQTYACEASTLWFSEPCQLN